MMTEVAVLFAPGFEEIEAITIVDILRRAGVTVQMVGVDTEDVIGAHGIQVKTNTTLASLDPKKIGALLLPGGSPGYVNLRNHMGVLTLIKTIYDSGKLVAAICAAPSALADAGVLNQSTCTIYPGMEEELEHGGGLPSTENVVQDKNVITSRGPATSIPFAIKIVEYLLGESKAKEVMEKTLANQVFTIK
jgi:4-methyl-5(b-hydroxyethyl)-thiazole monophosphate biosynthesis